jgi:hypothetical protein
MMAKSLSAGVISMGSVDLSTATSIATEGVTIIADAVTFLSNVVDS